MLDTYIENIGYFRKFHDIFQPCNSVTCSHVTFLFYLFSFHDVSNDMFLLLQLFHFFRVV